MANYPSFKLEGREKQYLTTVFSTKMWDVSTMPDKLYLHTGNGELVAIRPRFFTMVKCNTEHIEGSHEIFGFDMAGKGACALRVSTFGHPTILFKTPGDFERYRTSGQGAYQPDYLSAGDILDAEGYARDRYGIVLWYENKGVPTNRSGFFGFRVWIDRDGAHADHQSRSGYGTLYKTREECVASLSNVLVLDFDDEPAPRPKEFWVDLPDRVAVTALTEEEAKAKVRRGLESIIK